jgi:lysyl-tRNA synthetase class 2
VNGALRRVPLLAALATAAVALAELAFALVPAWHGSLGGLNPPLTDPKLRMLVVPVGVALLELSIYLARGHRRALLAAVTLLGGLGLAQLAVGREPGDAAGSIAVAGLLFASRGAFPVRSGAIRLRVEHARAAALGLGLLGVIVALSWLALPERPPALAFLRLTARGSGTDVTTAALVLGGVALAAAVAHVLFRAVLPAPPRPDAAGQVRAMLREHGSDTLCAFKLRRDLSYFLSADGEAFAAYRLEAGTLLLAGDPVGPPAAIPRLLRELEAFVELHGLRLGVVAAGAGLLPQYRRLGMRSFYIGDEAIVETRRFSLEGRAIRKVRQSVSRLRRAGFTAEVVAADSLEPPVAAALERISSAWLAGGLERGFSMALDTSTGGDGAMLAIARDGEGVPRGYIQFAPAYGRSAMSLAAMRREPGTPNGLMEFLVVSALEAFRDRGIEEVSLNFAAFGQVFRAPASLLDRLLARGLRIGGRFFQTESLYRFNAKFDPRWEPRYLVFDSMLAFPRVGLATLWVEGQLPRPARPSRSSTARAA